YRFFRLREGLHGMGRAVGSRWAAWADRWKHRALRDRRLFAVSLRRLHPGVAPSSWPLSGTRVEEVRFRRRVQPLDGLVWRGRAVHRSLHHYADGGKAPDGVRLEYLHGGSRRAVRVG